MFRANTKLTDVANKTSLVKVWVYCQHQQPCYPIQAVTLDTKDTGIARPMEYRLLLIRQEK